MSKLWRPFARPGADAGLRLRDGEDCLVRDAQGMEYIDCASGLWNVSLGLNHPAVIGAMHESLERLTYASLFDSTHAPAEALADQLLSLCGMDDGLAYLSTTGSSAVEIAIRVARTWQVLQDQPQRKTVISFDNSYHGGSWIAAQASGILQGGLASHEQSAGGFAFLPGPRDEAASLTALARYFDQHDGSVAAFIAEPILGSAGILVPTQNYWRTVRSMCNDYGVLLIADEVATGGGRCGAMLASSALGMRPDLITLSKGINSGYFPVAATLFSAKVAAPFQRGDYVMQLGSTQDGNPVGCAAASATLNFIRDQGLMAEAARKGERITAHLRQAGHAAIAEVRGVGLMIGIELQHTFGTAGAYSPAETVEVRNQLKQAGLLVYHFDGGISLFPSLLMSDDTVDDMLDILDSVFATLG